MNVQGLIDELEKLGENMTSLARDFFICTILCHCSICLQARE